MSKEEMDQLVLEALLNPVSECFITFTDSRDHMIFMAYEYEGSNTLIVKEICALENAQE